MPAVATTLAVAVLRAAVSVPHPASMGDAPAAPESLPILALGLVVAGIVTLALNPRDELVRVFGLLMLTSAAVVGTNPLYERGDMWAAAIEGAADGLGTALFVRFCLLFPERHRAAPLPWRWQRVVQRSGWIVPLGTSMIFVASTFTRGWLLSVGSAAIALGLTYGVLLGLLVLGRTFLLKPSAETRGPILVVWLGCTVAFLPLVALNALPKVLGRPDPISFGETSYTLVALPLAVGFASIRWRKVSLLGLIDRVSVYGLLGLVLLGCYAAIAVGVTRLEGDHITTLTGLLPLAMAIIAATTYAPLRAGIQRLVDTALYRDHYELGPTMQHFSQALAVVRDRDAVVHSLLEDLCATLNLSGAALVFLPGGLDAAVLRLLEPEDVIARGTYVRAEAARDLVDHLARHDITALGLSHLQPLALDPWPGCAALMVIGPGAGEDAIALLMLGSKRGGGYLRAEDRTLLATIANQAATALENASLVGGLQTTLAQLQQSTTQLEVARTEQQLLLRQVVEAEERERAALARELHDDALQDLLYVSRHSRYCAGVLAERVDRGLATSPEAKRLREELEQLAQAAALSERKLRDLCAGLYPALLESLGLLAAIESLSEEMVPGLTITMEYEPDVEPLAARLDGDTRLHVYRIIQEALRNASRHARAEHAQVRIATARAVRRSTGSSGTAVPPTRLAVTVTDDGVGTPLPIDYGLLLREGHLGLASMRERAERIGATLTVAPNQGGGTRITLIVPVPTALAHQEQASVKPTDRRITPPVPIQVAHTQPSGNERETPLIADLPPHTANRHS